MAGYRIEYNTERINAIKEANIRATIKTANSIKADLDKSQTVPFLTGALNQSAFINISDINNGGVNIEYSTPYAAKQYFVPMNHYTGQHPNATDHWLDPYATTKNKWVQETYQKHLKNEIRRGL